MKLARVITLWVTGLLASMLAGGAFVGLAFPNSYGDAPAGWLGGACAFTCLRLWLTENQK